MARRISATVVTLVVVLLGVIAVPLGLITASHDDREFRDDAVAVSAALASVAEGRLADHVGDPALANAINGLRRSGDQVAVYTAAGRWSAGTPARPAVPVRAVSQTLGRLTPITLPVSGRLIVLAPVLQDDGTSTVGAVALSLSTAALRQRVTLLWILIAAVSAGGLLAAAVTAAALARWVSRPLSLLEAAAHRLGSGALDTRSPVHSGPSEVRRLAANFNTMAGQLEALVDGHQVMMADVSHQLRTPLAALRLRLDVLAQDCDEPVAVELAGAQEEIARLSRLVDGLVAVARAEKVVAEPVLVPAAIVISDRTAAWRPAAAERGITLAAVSQGPVGARMGAGHLEQILDNVLANALEAVPAGGTVTISAAATGTARGSGARIVVADDGPGMAPQQQRTAFRRFSTSGGTGLGLAIVHRLVTSNGGSVALSDTPGGGLTVTIELPGVPDGRSSRRSEAISS